MRETARLSFEILTSQGDRRLFILYKQFSYFSRKLEIYSAEMIGERSFGALPLTNNFRFSTTIQNEQQYSLIL